MLILNDTALDGHGCGSLVVVGVVFFRVVDEIHFSCMVGCSSVLFAVISGSKHRVL